MRANYWSGSKFADWVRKRFADNTKPNAATMSEWREWKKDFRTAHPFIYWFTEDFLNDVQDVVNYPRDKLIDFRYWGYNRFVSKPHFMDTKLKRGQYHEVDTRILHGLFETLVDFVEIEKAWMNVVFSEEEREKYGLPWWKRVPQFLRWKQWRCPEAGIDHLKWEMSLVNECEWMTDDERANAPECGQPTSQAIAAREVFELYHWWKNVRPNRPDPYDESGWTAYCDSRRRDTDDLFFEDSTDEEKAQSSASLNSLHDIEKTYDDEDEEMLIRLIRIRQHLWT